MSAEQAVIRRSAALRGGYAPPRLSAPPPERADDPAGQVGRAIRWSGLGAMLGGETLMVKAIIDYQPVARRLGETSDLLFFIVQPLLLIGLVGLFVRLGGGTGRLGRLGFVAAFAGALLSVLGHSIDYLFDLAGLTWTFAFDVAALSTGLVLLGLAAARTNAATRWRTLPLLVGMLGFFYLTGFGVTRLLPNEVGLLLFGAGWVIQGAVLWTDRRERSAPRSALAG